MYRSFGVIVPNMAYTFIIKIKNEIDKQSYCIHGICQANHGQYNL